MVRKRLGKLHERFMKSHHSVMATFMAAARSGNFCRIVGVLNMLNALQSAWFHNSLWITGLIAFTSVFLLWISSLVTRELIISVGMPPPEVIAEMKRREEMMMETDPKKVM